MLTLQKKSQLDTPTDSNNCPELCNFYNRFNASANSAQTIKENICTNLYT